MCCFPQVLLFQQERDTFFFCFSSPEKLTQSLTGVNTGRSGQSKWSSWVTPVSQCSCTGAGRSVRHFGQQINKLTSTLWPQVCFTSWPQWGENRNLATVTSSGNLSRCSLCNSRAWGTLCTLHALCHPCHLITTKRLDIWWDGGGPESSKTASCFESPPRLVEDTTMALCATDRHVKRSGPLRRSRRRHPFYSWSSSFSETKHASTNLFSIKSSSSHFIV